MYVLLKIYLNIKLRIKNRSSHNVIIEMSNFEEIQDNREEVVEINDTIIYYIKSNYKYFEIIW